MITITAGELLATRLSQKCGIDFKHIPKDAAERITAAVEDMAIAIGISTDTITRCLEDKRDTLISNLVFIAKYLECSGDDIIDICERRGYCITKSARNVDHIIYDLIKNKENCTLKQWMEYLKDTCPKLVPEKFDFSKKE